MGQICLISPTLESLINPLYFETTHFLFECLELLLCSYRLSQLGVSQKLVMAVHSQSKQRYPMYKCTRYYTLRKSCYGRHLQKVTYQGNLKAKCTVRPRPHRCRLQLLKPCIGCFLYYLPPAMNVDVMRKKLYRNVSTEELKDSRQCSGKDRPLNLILDEQLKTGKLLPCQGFELSTFGLRKFILSSKFEKLPLVVMK